MFEYCCSNGEKLDGGTGGSFGFIAESENYRYCLRCTPRNNDYSYIYIYDIRRQELNMKNEEKPVIAHTSYANGEAFEHTDPEAFLKELREELPYRNTTGFRFEVLSHDPALRKAADDELYNLFGEENPRPLEDYQETPDQGMTMGGM